MKFENTEVMNLEGAIRGMRNPMESWDKSDSNFGLCIVDDKMGFNLGGNDLNLMQNLLRAGTSDSKFMRQIFVCVDITAPLYWWKEFDTYKVGTVSNSTSTMHKLASTPITMDCFEMGDFNPKLFINTENGITAKGMWDFVIPTYLESLRQKYNETKDKRYWKELIRLLPESWLQKRTITMSYENIRNMYFQRRNHKLTEWKVDFINWVKSLPYTEELIMLEK